MDALQVDALTRFKHDLGRNNFEGLATQRLYTMMTETAPEFAGDVWTWTALDADSKLIVSYLVGGRDMRICPRIYGRC